MKRFVIVQNSIKTVLIFRSGYIKELLNYGLVIVIAPNDDDESKKILQDMGVVIHDVSIHRVLSIFQMNKLIIKERLLGSVIISHFLVTFISCYISLIPFNSKLIVYTEGLGSIFSNNSILRRLLRMFLVNNSAVRFFCNTSERKYLGLKTDFVTNGIGVDLSKFNKKKFDKFNSSFNLLYVGRLIRDKGIQDVIDAFRLLKEMRSDVRLNLVGDIYPNNPSSLKENDIDFLKKEFGDSINFVGFTHDVKYWYDHSDLLILPSKREGFPVCIMEASAVGLPSIGYNVVGVQDAIKPGVNGELVKFGDIISIARISNEILNRNSIMEYINTASNYANDNFCCKEKNNKLVSKMLELSN
ncbi:glycosyltransferase [Aliivibrio fischeri]|nr:glycosyltransferase [Aliivibrio fischeri]